MNISKEQKDKAQNIMEELDCNELYINGRGEFFSSENLAGLSVKGNKKEFLLIKREAEQKTSRKGNKKLGEIEDTKDLLKQKQELLDELNTNFTESKPEEKEQIQESIKKTGVEIAQLETQLETLKGE